MSPRKRIVLLIGIMAVIVVVLESIVIVLLYRTAFNEQRENLRDMVTSQARLIESVARFDRMYTKTYPGLPVDATLSQIMDAHLRYRGFGLTGEFTLSKREGDWIVFILNHRHGDLDKLRPVPFRSNLVQPARLALSGESGAMVGLDYRGEVVLAAYEPVQDLNWGIVAKIDMSEVRAPFIRAALISFVVGVFIVILGSMLFVRVTEPLITHLRNTVSDLKEALASVNQLSGLLPICASCKKIRDDKGYWTQIEMYIRDHSEANFSHGICPDCAKKLYGDLRKGGSAQKEE